MQPGDLGLIFRCTISPCWELAYHQFTMATTEHRQHLRYTARIDVEIEWNKTMSRVPISDISLGGMFIRTSEVLTVGSEFEAYLLLDNPISVRCEVRHVVPARGMGVQFLNLEGSSRAELEQFLTKLAVPVLSSSSLLTAVRHIRFGHNSSF